MFKSLRTNFFSGLILLLPLGVTVMFVNFLMEKIGARTSNLFFWFIDPAIRQQAWVQAALDITSILVIVLGLCLVGWISRYFLGRFVVGLAESIIHRVPGINSLYKTVKQIVDTFSKQSKAVFQEVVLVEYPRPNCWALGFLTSTAEGEVQSKTGAKVVNIFVPTTPNPTSGFLLMLPETDIIHLEMTVSEGMKLVISGGAVVPDYLPKKAKAKSASAASKTAAEKKPRKTVKKPAKA